jgi:hypothetical protein
MQQPRTAPISSSAGGGTGSGPMSPNRPSPWPSSHSVTDILGSVGLSVNLHGFRAPVHHHHHQAATLGATGPIMADTAAAAHNYNYNYNYYMYLQSCNPAATPGVGVANGPAPNSAPSANPNHPNSNQGAVMAHHLNQGITAWDIFFKKKNEIISAAKLNTVHTFSVVFSN